jgi:RES domain-containing protein
VISGDGTRVNGGRFAPVGVRAVYASADEATALREVTARKILAARNRIKIADYPRMTYLIAVSTARNIDLGEAANRGLRKLVTRCLTVGSWKASQEVAAVWIAAGIESVTFPSATGVGAMSLCTLGIRRLGVSRLSIATRLLAALRKASRDIPPEQP